MGKSNKGMQMMGKVMVMSAPALYILVFFSTIVVILFGALLFFAEGSSYSVDAQFTDKTVAAAAGGVHFPHGVFVRSDAAGYAKEPTPVRSIPAAFWWVFTTMTTVGYGDIYPTTLPGKVVGILLFYVGILLLALPITILGMNFRVVYEAQFAEGERIELKAKEAAVKERKEAEIRATVRRKSMASPGKVGRGLGGADPNRKLWFPSVDAGLRQAVFSFFDDPDSSRGGKVVSILVLFIIVCSSTTFCLETMPQYRERRDACAVPVSPPMTALTLEACEPRSVPIFAQLETVFIAIFTIEYLARALTVHAVPYTRIGLARCHGGAGNTLCYLSQGLNIVDAVAILPFYAELLLSEGGGGLAVLRVLRLVRVFRIFKMGKYSSGAMMVVNVVLDSLPVLSMLFFLSLLFCVLFASMMYFAEGTSFSVDPEWLQGGYPTGVYVRPSVDGHSIEVSPFRSIPFAAWWFFTTTTTVGYGDFYPTTTAGKCVGVFCFFAGIILMALPITVIGGNFSKYYEDWANDTKIQLEEEEKLMKEEVARKAATMQRKLAVSLKFRKVSAQKSDEQLLKEEAAMQKPSQR